MNYDEFMTKFQDNIGYFLEKGVNPWQAPWIREPVFSAADPHNGKNARRYHGINEYNLLFAAYRYFDGDTRFFTQNQINKMGLSVKEGEEELGTPVFFFSDRSRRIKKDEDGNPVKDENGKDVYETFKISPIFRTYIVYNGQQINGLMPFKDWKEKFEKDQEPTSDNSIDGIDQKKADEFIKNSPVKIIEREKDSFEAFYQPSTDSIQINSKSSFKNQSDYYSTVFHEMIHSTGPATRLNRESFVAYGQAISKRAEEELIAEIGSVILSDKVNLHYSNSNSASYIESWANLIKNPEFKLSSVFPQVNDAVGYIAHPDLREKLVKKHQEREKEVTQNIPSEITEPMLEIKSSTSSLLESGEKMTLYTAEKIIRQINENALAEHRQEKVNFCLYYHNKGDVKSYSGRFVTTGQNQNLIEAIQKSATFSSKTSWATEAQKHFFQSFIKPVLVPYLANHERLSQLEEVSDSYSIEGYKKYLANYCLNERSELNKDMKYIPRIPMTETEYAEKKVGENQLNQNLGMKQKKEIKR